MTHEDAVKLIEAINNLSSNVGLGVIILMAMAAALMIIALAQAVK